jgi:gliding motility-associated-like protein
MWLTSPVQSSQTISNIAAGTYTVTVTDAKGCNNTMLITVPSAGPPYANFTYEPDTVNLLDANIHFLDMSVNAYQWNWDFGDPNNPAGSNEQNPFHVYSDTGLYCITLIITDQGGVCKDTAVKCIYIEAPFTFYIPNTFTPNGDNLNELFMGYGTFIKEFKMWIWDRWGNLIWSCETNGEPQLSSNCQWDGKVVPGGPDLSGGSRQLVQEDVYVWKALIVDVYGRKKNFKGHLTVVK